MITANQLISCFKPVKLVVVITNYEIELYVIIHIILYYMKYSAEEAIYYPYSYVIIIIMW